jgi:hypothetical protein
MLFPGEVEVWLEAFLILHAYKWPASRFGRFISGVRAPLPSGYYAGKAPKYIWTHVEELVSCTWWNLSPNEYCSIQFHVTCYECHWRSVWHATLPETFVKTLNFLQGPTTCFGLYGHHHVPKFLVWGNCLAHVFSIGLFLLLCVFFVPVLP